MNFRSQLRYDLQKTVNLRILALSFGLGLLLTSIRPAVHANQASIDSVLIDLLGGFEFQEFISIDNIIMWILLLIPYSISETIPLQLEYDGTCKNSLLYFGSYHKWYFSKVISIGVAALLVSAAVVVGSIISCWLWGIVKTGSSIQLATGERMSGWLGCLISLGILQLGCWTLLSFQMLVHLISGSSTWSTISAIVPYAFGLFSYSDTFDSNIPLYVPTNWSMFARSSLVSAPGWNVGTGIIAEVVIIITFSIAEMVLCKKMQIAARISK